MPRSIFCSIKKMKNSPLFFCRLIKILQEVGLTVSLGHSIRKSLLKCPGFNHLPLFPMG
ncbi:Hypothetical protein Minf_1392 [Methylacidiphilum infernorum V4]|uniref:Uncharacterized protein n=1 Tax=Methylacidiphilum infernorum (isolate V4) TaxID=481448 RepID=B3DVU3_METI4|nr:Hypothetical protein Minf_1392 [Methylacidiphilum infernorum V4]